VAILPPQTDLVFMRPVVEQKSSSLDPFDQVEAEKPQFNMVRACVCEDVENALVDP
jgi:hypothetical protein